MYHERIAHNVWEKKLMKLSVISTRIKISLTTCDRKSNVYTKDSKIYRAREATSSCNMYDDNIISHWHYSNNFSDYVLFKKIKFIKYVLIYKMYLTRDATPPYLRDYINLYDNK